MSEPPRLSVIIVTWNSGETIAACLASLRDSTIPGTSETIVIDNASSDGTADLIARDFAEVSLIRSAENAGFAAANNTAMAAASGEFILLLNPDTLLHDAGAIARMIDTMDADPTIAMLGPRLVFGDGAHQVGDAGWRPSAVTMISHAVGLAHLLPWLKSLYLVRPGRIRSAIVEVDWVCGACLLVRRAAVHAAGGLDASLFLYAEDVEWGCRLRRHGFRVVYLPGVRVTHLQGRSESQAAAVSTRWLTSLLELYLRLNGRRWLRAVCLSLALGFLARAAVYAGLRILRPSRASRYMARQAALLAYAGVVRKRAGLF